MRRLLTPEVIELLTVALSVRGRSVVMARCPGGGACTLLVMGQDNSRTTLYFHASTATSAALEAEGVEKLRRWKRWAAPDANAASQLFYGQRDGR